MKHLTPIDETGGCTRKEYPSLSVVIAVKNEEERIADTIKSLLSSNYPGLKVVVVNDRSDDRTEKLISEIGQTESRLKSVTVKGASCRLAWKSECDE